MARRHRPTLEALDDRTLPAVFGIPWPDARHLTLSFAPDGTQIAGHQSNLFGALDAQMPPAVWQGDVLRALQTWAAYANISVGVVPDGGQPFGTQGLTQGDPRFGDIRIGAQAMAPSALAVSVPHDPFVSGTLAGDVFLNSAYSFTGPTTDLYSVMLHEFGHVLGLGDSTDPNSVLYEYATTPRDHLAPSDIAAIQALYGVRAPDPYQGHATLATAASLRAGDGGGSGSYPLVAYGSLAAPGADDVFAVRSLRGYQGPMTVRLLTAGISLLEPRLTVYDASGNVLGQSLSTDPFGGVVSVTLNAVAPGTTYYVQADGAVPGVFGVGRYGLAVSFDNNLTVTEAQIDAVLRGPFDTLSGRDVGEIFRDPQGVLFNNDGARHGQFATAAVLSTPFGYAAGTHYEAVGSLNDSAGGDYYLLTAPAADPGAPLVLTATVGRMSVNGVGSRVDVFDANQQPVAATVLVNEDGTFTVQVADAQPGATYYVKVSAAHGESENGGNYSLVVDFHQPAALMQTLAQGTFSAGETQADGTLYVAQNQLFHFVLSAPTGGSAAAVDVQVLDPNGNDVFDLAAAAGGVGSGTAFLVPGAYTVRLTWSPSAPAAPPSGHRSDDDEGHHGHGSSGNAAVPPSYLLRLASITDPVGPALADPTLQPLYTQPNDPLHYYYPGGTVSSNPYFWLPLL